MPELPNPFNPLDQGWKNRDLLWAQQQAALRVALPGVAVLNEKYGPDPSQRMDVYKHPTPRGVVVWWHGGGWQTGDKVNDTSALLAADTLANGFTFIAADYRLVPQAVWPSQGEDVTAVVAHARQFGPVCMVGASAGAHLATWGANLSGVAAAAGWFGVYDLVGDYPTLEVFFRPFAGERGDPRRLSASPLWQASPDTAPVLFVVDQFDNLVPAHQTDSYRWRLMGLGQEAPLYYAPYGGHGVGLPAAVFVAAYVQRTVEWFVKHS